MKRNWFARHPIGFMALYFLLYLSAFNFLETQISMPRVLLVHCRLDDLIPFCKYAIVPYFAWFAWIPFTLFYLLWKAPREDFWRLLMNSESDFFFINGVTDAGDSLAVVGLLRDQTAEKVQLVRSGNCDQDICSINTCLH